MLQNVPNPRPMLVMGLDFDRERVVKVVEGLTGTTPEDPLEAKTFQLTVATPHVSANVPVWVNLVCDCFTDLNHVNPYDDFLDPGPYVWEDLFKGDAATPVRKAMGGMVAVINASEPVDLYRTFIEVAGRCTSACGRARLPAVTDPDYEGAELFGESIGGVYFDGAKLVVGVSDRPLTEEEQYQWDDVASDAFLEFVLIAPGQQRRNRFRERTGWARIREVLEINDWDGGPSVPLLLGPGSESAASFRPPGNGRCHDEEVAEPGSGSPDRDGDDDDAVYAVSLEEPGSGIPDRGYDDDAVYAVSLEEPGSGRPDRDGYDGDAMPLDFGPNPAVPLNFGHDPADFDILFQVIAERSNRETYGDGSNGRIVDVDLDVGDFANILMRLQAARAEAENLPPGQRELLAAARVADIVRDLQFSDED